MIKVNNLLTLTQLKAYVMIGFIFLSNTGVFSQNQNYADSLINFLEINDNISDSLKLEVYKGIFVGHTNQEIRLKYANEAFKIAKKSNDQLWLYKSSLNIGHAQRKKGNLKKSLIAYYKSLDYAKTLRDKRREALVYSAIGSVYKIEGNPQTALTYFNLGISNLREISDSTNLAKSLMNTGELYRTYHTLDTALIYFKESGELFKTLDSKIGNAYNLGNIGLVYAEQEKHAQAEENIVKATEVLEELGDHYPIAVYNTYMADIYQEKGEFNRALEYAKNSYDIALEEGLKEQIRDASLKLAELYEVAEDYENAFHYQKLYIDYRDSINNEETIRQMADLRTEYEVAQKQAEVDLLSQKQKTLLIIGAALIALLLMFGALVVVLNKRNIEKRSTNRLLVDQKQKLEYQHKELEKLNATKDRFFSIISHDLRGPVSAFIGLASLLKYSIQHKSYKQLPEITDRIESSANQLSFLLGNLLDWAVNQQGQFPYKQEKIELLELTQEIAEVFQNMAVSKGVSLTIDIDKEIAIWADRNSMMAILRNLLNNALKFTDKGGLVKVSATAKEDSVVVLNVYDNGVGIPKKLMNSLFQLNEKKSTQGTEGEKGLGLGLTLAYEFAEMNKGNLSVESKEGEGTTFTVEIPLYVNEMVVA